MKLQEKEVKLSSLFRYVCQGWFETLQLLKLVSGSFKYILE